MKRCPICKTGLGLLLLKYKNRFNQYPCTKCKLVYLESKIGLVNRATIESLNTLMDDKKFENLLNRLGE